MPADVSAASTPTFVRLQPYTATRFAVFFHYRCGGGYFLAGYFPGMHLAGARSIPCRIRPPLPPPPCSSLASPPLLLCLPWRLKTRLNNAPPRPIISS